MDSHAWVVQVMLALPLPYAVLKTKGVEMSLEATNEEGLTIVWEFTPTLTTFAMRDTLGQVHQGEGVTPKEAFARRQIVNPTMQQY